MSTAHSLTVWRPWLGSPDCCRAGSLWPHHGRQGDRVAQRSYSKTVALQYERDKARKLLRPITKGGALVTVIGADGTGVGKRSIMHVASSIAPSYRDGISVENEKNINTVATSITDDHWAGLNEVLCSNFYIGTGDILPPNSIAADINGMLRTGLLPGTDVPVKVTGCFDLVAAS